MKRRNVIRLSESKLKRIVAESVKRTLREMAEDNAQPSFHEMCFCVAEPEGNEHVAEYVAYLDGGVNFNGDTIEAVCVGETDYDVKVRTSNGEYYDFYGLPYGIQKQIHKYIESEYAYYLDKEEYGFN